MKPVITGVSSFHCPRISANRAAVGSNSTAAAPKAASVTMKSRASTGRAGEPRSVRARATSAEERRSPVLMTASSERGEHSRVSSMPESSRSTGVRISSRSALNARSPCGVKTGRAMASASSRTRPSSRRACAISPSAAERAARISQSVVSPKADTTTATGRGAAEISSSTRGRRPGVPSDVPPNL